MSILFLVVPAASQSRLDQSVVFGRLQPPFAGTIHSIAAIDNNTRRPEKRKFWLPTIGKSHAALLIAGLTGNTGVNLPVSNRLQTSAAKHSDLENLAADVGHVLVPPGYTATGRADTANLNPGPSPTKAGEKLQTIADEKVVRFETLKRFRTSEAGLRTKRHGQTDSRRGSALFRFDHEWVG